MLKSTDTKRSKSRSSSGSHRGSSSSSCLSSAFTLDAVGSAEFQLDALGADQSDITDLLETLQSQDGSALLSDLSDSGCLPFDPVDPFSFSFSSSNSSLGLESGRHSSAGDGLLASQTNDALSNFNSAANQADAFNGEQLRGLLAQ